ncbi:MAG: hypothetical protein EOO22_02680 [Comamonadaceae bacterium]|nr:MAG: hypothetical protein EOO22_02680 [Comamonadaceae bacterium]
MASNLRTPPRFVPTLTTVVEDDGLSAVDTPAGAATLVASEAEGMSPTDANLEDGAPEAPSNASASSSSSHIALTPADMAMTEDRAFHIEEQLLHRVLQRIDLSLEQRLSDVVSSAVQQRLDAMVPALRQEIEEVLRSLVIEALADELPPNTGSERSGKLDTLG